MAIAPAELLKYEQLRDLGEGHEGLLQDRFRNHGREVTCIPAGWPGHAGRGSTPQLNQRHASWLLMAPGLLWLTALMIVPCLLIFMLAFYERGIYGGIDWSSDDARQFPPRIPNRSIFRSFSTARGWRLRNTDRTAHRLPAAYAIAKAPAVMADGPALSSRSCRSGRTT
jgi:hypothetical protein